MHYIIHKQIGETPLETLERFRLAQGIADKVPMTYAGRLDPMAEGELLILVGEECKHKDKYLGLDKEYEVDIVFGIETDTYDALGLAKRSQIPKLKGGILEISDNETIEPLLTQSHLQRYMGKFDQEYPPYSSRTVDGVALHELARAGRLPDLQDMPKREVEIYEIEVLKTATISGLELQAFILDKIDLVQGDFRQEEIKQRWQEVLDDGLSGNESFDMVTIRVRCSSGTYMRSLAQQIGKDLGTGAFALGIKRTKIFLGKSLSA